jgi:hypothetical protein
MQGYPTIHLNGTGAQSLLSDYQAAYDAVRDFRQKFGSIQFHARDYYVDGPDSFAEATEARMEIGRMIQEIHHYLEFHLLHLHDQAGK